MTVHELYDQAVIERWQAHAQDLARKVMVWAMVAVLASSTTIALLLLIATRGLSA